MKTNEDIDQIIELIIVDTEDKMERSYQGLISSLSLVRSGRATPGLVEDIKIEAYGDIMPLNQLANISIPEARLITVDAYDKSQLQAIEKGIQKSGRNLNPQNDGSLIRIPLPEMSEETRREMVKIAKAKTEDHKVSIRNIRRDSNDALRKLKSEGVSEDVIKVKSADVQKMTDRFIQRMHDLMIAKEEEIMTV